MTSDIEGGNRYTLWGKKTAPFYFCNNVVKYCYIWNNYWCAYTLINLEQNYMKIVNLL